MKKYLRFRPRTFTAFENYGWHAFSGDLAAGLTVGVVALPLAMAFAIASGVPPERGLYTAVLAGFIISFFSGSKVQIGGPTAAFISVLAVIVARHSYEGLVVCSIMAGVILIAMGVARMGALIKFIPYPITSGFTSGIAVSISLGQVKDILGLQVDKLPTDFTEKLLALIRHLDTFRWPTLLLGLGSFVFLFLWPRLVSKRVPGSIIMLVIATCLVTFAGLPVETIADRFGGIPVGLPHFTLPHFDLRQMKELFPDAMTIAVLAAIESLLCAVVADGMIGDRHDSNTELIAQGLANLVVPFFGGIPATGAIARTATNIQNGGRTPLAGMIHAAVLLVIMLVAAPLAKYVPLAVLSAIVIVVAVNMGDWHEFRRLRKMPRSDAFVLVATFLLTVIFDLTVAVEVGMVLAAFLFIKRVSETTQITQVTHETEQEGAHHSVIGKELPEGVLIYRIYGCFFFGAAEKMEEALEQIHQLPKVLILKMHTVPAMDATALNALESVVEKMAQHGNHVILSGPHTQPYFMMVQAGFIDRLGEQNVTADLDAALARARFLLAVEKEPLVAKER